MTITQQEVDTLRHEFVTQAINHRLISDMVSRSSRNVEYCNECFNTALTGIGRKYPPHLNMTPGVKRDGVRVASTFIQGYLTAKSMEGATND